MSLVLKISFDQLRNSLNIFLKIGIGNEGFFSQYDGVICKAIKKSLALFKLAFYTTADRSVYL